jgi:D-alanine-D-alanine ligase
VLVLWNQVEEDIYEKWREQGPTPLEWDPSRVVPDVGTVDEEMKAFIQALKDARFEVQLVNVEDELERILAAVNLYRPDAVFNLVEYFNDDQVQEAYIAGLYELMGVDFTGSRAVTLATCQNKFRTKLILEAAGLPTAGFFLAKKLPVAEDHELEYPLIVKPAFEDASGGIDKESVVHNHAALEARVAYLLKEFEMPALVEEYVDGREIHAAILGNHPPEVLPLFEMEFDDSEFNPEEEWRPQIISYRAKWDPHSKDFYTMEPVVPPSDLDPEIAEEIRRVARGAYLAMGCRDYARVDMRIEDDEVYILEVNPNPDLVDGAAYMMCAKASGRSYAETLGAIGDLAIARSRYAPDEEFDKPSDTLLREHKQGAPLDTGPSVPNEPPAHYHGLEDEDEEDEEADADFQTVPSMEFSGDEAIDATVPGTAAFVEAQTVLATVDGKEGRKRPDTETEPHEMVIPNGPPGGRES